MPAATVATTASVSPYVQLQSPVYVHAQRSDSLAVSRVALPGLASMLSTMFVPQAWFFSTLLDFPTLAAALARVLEKYPVYAGRVVDVSPPRGTVSVETNNKGIPLHAGSANLGLKDLLPDFAPGDVLAQHPSLGELLPVPTAATPEDLRNQCTPLIVASLISLSDNACALSVRFWHGLFDQQSIGQFMQDWAQAYNGALSFDDVEAIAKQTSRVESAVSVPVDEESTVDMSQLKNPMAGPVFFPDTDTINALTARMIEELVNPRTVYRTAFLPQVAISQLVAVIRKIDPRVSQHDCVGAWLWKTLASARSRGPTRFCYPIDARWRLGGAPLARGCLLIAGVTAPAEAATTSLSALAGYIRDSVTDPSAFAKCVARYSAGQGPVMSSANVLGEGPGSAQDLCVMQWTRFANCDDFRFGAAGAASAPVAFVPLGGPIEPRMPNLAAVWRAARPPSVSNAAASSAASGLVIGITLYECEVPAFASAVRGFADGKFDLR
ncbi:hypothetical protein BDZ88DRAFT_431780 [Geranomyces variabilis]|nr:hypothetical protein BDZ88DRAFT_431780 [Geranomyces variabilis]KAJ3138249.1 hypothetical protein HDU90_001211 [Geranomyces variabilis]